MKIKKLLLSVCMVCLALLVFGGATVPAMQFSTQALVVRAASDYSTLEPKELFNKKGNYTVDMDYLKSSLANGQVFSFFGYEWRVVFINETENVATFWMKDPYTSSVFNRTKRAGNGFFIDGSNIWSNGYTNMMWDSNQGDVTIGQSIIRDFLIKESSKIINDKKYSNYKKKVVAGHVNGTNEASTESKIAKIAFSLDSLDQVEVENEATDKLTAQYGLSDADRLWLPSRKELVDLWNVHTNILAWNDNTNNGGRAWLRTPYLGAQSSEYATCVCFEPAGLTSSLPDDFFVGKAVGQEAGVRPAIHLNISELTESGSANGWFNEDWLKTLFIVVCVLGIVGIVLVITAVVLKSRQKQAK